MTQATLERSDLAATDAETAVYRKVSWRLMPFLMLCYVVAYLDRVNVGFAKLQMLNDLGLSETVYGLGAGIFFFGYFLFEVPSNLALHRIGAKVWIARIMITWGLLSGACIFISGPVSFYVMRFLLGAAEAGFFPGVILYLTYWYPAHWRGKIITLFMAAIPLSGVVGGPMSGAIMDWLAGAGGWAGWQWMFVIEAVPALLLGVAVLAYLDNSVEQAKWLSQEEKRIVARAVAADQQGTDAHGSLGQVFADGRVWLMCLLYFCCVVGQYGLTFWLPTLVKSAGVQGPLNIGLFTAIPYVTAVVAMVLFGRSADRRRERRWHLAIPALLGTIGLVGAALAGQHAVPAIILLSVAAAGVLSSAPLFWAFPTAFLTGVSAAAGIAVINSVGNLAGFASPYMIGWIKDSTGSTDLALYVIAAVLLVGAGIALSVPARLVNR
jgi:D-galactonate transporter